MQDSEASWSVHLENTVSLTYRDFPNATIFHKACVAKSTSVNVSPELIRKVHLDDLENDQASRTDSHLSLGYDFYQDIFVLLLAISLTGCLPWSDWLVYSFAMAWLCKAHRSTTLCLSAAPEVEMEFMGGASCSVPDINSSQVFSARQTAAQSRTAHMCTCVRV